MDVAAKPRLGGVEALDAAARDQHLDPVFI
jgi:hypothetical protein